MKLWKLLAAVLLGWSWHSGKLRKKLVLDNIIKSYKAHLLVDFQWYEEVKVAQSCLTLRPHEPCNPPGSSVHGTLIGILQWVAIPFSKGSSQPRDWTQVSRIAGEFFTNWATREAPSDMRWANNSALLFSLVRVGFFCCYLQLFYLSSPKFNPVSLLSTFF